MNFIEYKTCFENMASILAATKKSLPILDLLNVENVEVPLRQAKK